jgi:hypothetical protein
VVSEGPEEDAAGAVGPEVAQALQTIQTEGAEQAAARLRPLADGGDLAASVALLQLLWSPTWTEGIPYAKRVAAAGVPTPFLVNYLNNMLADATYRADGVALARELAGSGLQFDYAGQAQALAQQGDVGNATALLELSTLPSTAGAQQAWNTLLVSAQASLVQIRDQETQASAEREKAVAAILQHEQAVGDDRQRLRELAEQVDALVHAVTSEQLAREYAEQAKKEEGAAGNYTWAALIVAGLTAVLTLAFAGLVLFGDHDAADVLGKASLAIPLLAFAAYVGKLAGDHRRMAWHWRHVELQIRTADPFIAPLDDPTRKAILAALALRLFPGQAQDPQRGGAEAPDPTAFLTELARPPSSPPPA